MTDWQRNLCVLYDIPPWKLQHCTWCDRLWWIRRTRASDQAKRRRLRARTKTPLRQRFSDFMFH